MVLSEGIGGRLGLPSAPILNLDEDLKYVVDDVRVGEDIHHRLENGSGDQVVEEGLQREAVQAVLWRDEREQAAGEVVDVSDLLVPAVSRRVNVGADHIVVRSCNESLSSKVQM